MRKTFPAPTEVKIDFSRTGKFLLTLSRLQQVGCLAPNVHF